MRSFVGVVALAITLFYIVCLCKEARRSKLTLAFLNISHTIEKVQQ